MHLSFIFFVVLISLICFCFILGSSRPFRVYFSQFSGRVFSQGVVFVVAITLSVILSESAHARAKKSAAHKNSRPELSSVSLPKDHEVCFSPDEPCDLKLVKFIQSAEKSIDIAVFDISLDQLVHHLLIKAKKIPVRIVVDKRQAKGRHSLVPLLAKAGVGVRYGKQRGLMHHKFTVIDAQAVQMGSFNYTNHAMKANRENQVYLRTPAVVERFKNQFEMIWKSAKPVSLEKEADPAAESALFG